MPTAPGHVEEDVRQLARTIKDKVDKYAKENGIPFVYILGNGAEAVAQKLQDPYSKDPNVPADRKHAVKPAFHALMHKSGCSAPYSDRHLPNPLQRTIDADLCSDLMASFNHCLPNLVEAYQSRRKGSCDSTSVPELLQEELQSIKEERHHGKLGLRWKYQLYPDDSPPPGINMALRKHLGAFIQAAPNGTAMTVPLGPALEASRRAKGWPDWMR